MTYSFGSVEPIAPHELQAAMARRIPDVVFAAVNNLLAKHGGRSIITINKNEIVDEIQRLEGPTRGELISNNWLDFEPAYRDVGWDVNYETGDWGAEPHTFTFKKR
jgi:hypothetical protein